MSDHSPDDTLPAGPDLPLGVQVLTRLARLEGKFDGFAQTLDERHERTNDRIAKVEIDMGSLRTDVDGRMETVRSEVDTLRSTDAETRGRRSAYTALVAFVTSGGVFGLLALLDALTGTPTPTP